MIDAYLSELSKTIARGDAREESFYPAFKDLITAFAHEHGKKHVDVTVLPKQTDAGNPDFRVWDGSHRVIGYIEAKAPEATDLGRVAKSEQLKRYLGTFPNVILTNFSEFRFYRNGEELGRVELAVHQQHKKLKENFTLKADAVPLFEQLLTQFLGYDTPAITKPDLLAKELARRTRFLRDQVVRIELAEEGGQGHMALHGFYEAFKKHLIATLTTDEFADLYAQTLTYGMFSARMRCPEGEVFTRESAFRFIPRTIGVLRDIFRYISLEDSPKALSVLIDDIADVLRATDVKTLLVKYKGSDPVIHFYETFLAEYDPALREKRGVYYTPEPVVGYIVRSLHHILQKDFGKAAGFADPSVTVLDPAGGTLTFHAHAVRVAVEEHVKRYGDGDRDRFIREHILPHFFAFELMMAPYAVGHLKMSFVLEDLGHPLQDGERFPLYLTNTLELEDIAQTHMPGLSSLSEESRLAGRVKREQPILVVLGNPPYSGESKNPSETTRELKKGQEYVKSFRWNAKSDRIEPVFSKAVKDGPRKVKTFIGELQQEYYFVDGAPLDEQTTKWLQNDYAKFIRFAQWKIHQSGAGVLGFITDNSYLSGPIFRGMRQSLLRSFDEIHIVNLHGNLGGSDENVFEIMQGVAIVLFVKRSGAPATSRKPNAKVKYHERIGRQDEKYLWLNDHDLKSTQWKDLEPTSPRYHFLPLEKSTGQGYEQWLAIGEVFPLNGAGMTTARDKFVMDMNPNTLFQRVRSFRASTLPDAELHEAFGIAKKKGWSIRKSWQQLQAVQPSALKDLIRPVSFRPFDERSIAFHDAIVWRTVKRVSSHLTKPNIAIVTSRQAQKGFQHVFLTEHPAEFNLTGTAGKYGSGYVFPLYLYPTTADKDDLFSTKRTEREANLSAELVAKLAKAHKRTPTPEQMLHYVYAVLYSPPYREKYAELLRIDFPRIPFTAERRVFEKLATLGEKLVELHLLKSPELDQPVVTYRGNGANDMVEKVRYDAPTDFGTSCNGGESPPMGRVWINDEKYFDGISEALWNYHIGGYQVLDKYLKERKDMVLQDPPRYCRIATALARTMEIQVELGKVYGEVEREVLGG